MRRPRVMDRSRLRSLGFKRRLTNTKRSWNKSLTFFWMPLFCVPIGAPICLWTTVGHASPGPGLGQALTLCGHRFQDPFGQLLDNMKVQS